MEDRELQNVLNSGEITAIYIGGQATTDKVQVESDMEAANIGFDDTGLGVTATTSQEALAALAEVGLVVLSGSSLAAQTIGTTATKIVFSDTKSVEAGVGVAGDVSLNRASALLAGVFKLRFEMFLSYASNVDITWRIYKNGAAFGNSITLPGQGAKVFPITLITSTSLAQGDYLELFAAASSATDITVAQANGTLEKTIF